MKQIVQNIKKKTLTLEEVPTPLCKSGGVLVKTHYSAVSVGTEVMKLKNADLSYLQMAKKKPDQVKEVISTLKQMGPMATYRKVMNKLDSLSPLGYSLSGQVIKVGKGVDELKIGDMVACGGAGYANHAQINFIPKNLCTPIPPGVEPRQASFATIAAVAMQGFRQTQSQIGENVAVIGLGLLGQILIQIIQANGCRAFGFDISQSKCELAKENGAYFAQTATKTDFDQEIAALTNGFGVDSVIVSTGTSSNDPIILAGKIVRDKGTIVDIGITKMDLPWDLYYHKELDFRFSRSYGPGRYDPHYEEGGIDYPVGYVRWTEQRNMASVLQLIKDGKIDLSKLISHEYNFNDAQEVFPAIKAGKEDYLGVVLTYDAKDDVCIKPTIVFENALAKETTCDINLGLVGAGNYASTMLIPFLKDKVNMAAIATATGITAKDKADKYGFGMVTTEYTQLLEHGDINLVMITTRHNQHAPMVLNTINKGKNVYVEKPLAISIGELKSIDQAFEEHHPVLMVGYNRRYSSSVKYLKTQLTQNTPYSIYYQVNSGFIPKDKWYQAPEQGGRIIGECGHFVDTLQYLLDAQPVAVFASSTQTQDMPEQDNTYITIKFSNGSSAVIAYLADGDKNYSKEKILITGGKANIEFDNFKSVSVFKDGKSMVKKFVMIDKGQKEEMTVLVDAVKSRTMPVPMETLTLNCLATIKAVESIKTRQSYALSLSDIKC